MEIKDFQNLCAGIVDKIDKRYNIMRDSHFSFTQLMEEVGELAKAINLPMLRNKKLDQDNLNEEFADIFLQLSILAKIHNVDFESAVKTKILELKERHNIDVGDIK
jgi:NTP pyrophosphatase (non-canonical NTP hydrolase)